VDAPGETGDAGFARTRWWWSESRANESPSAFPCYTGKSRKLFQILADTSLFCSANSRISLVYLWNFPTRANREFSQPNREIVGIIRERFRFVIRALVFGDRPYHNRGNSWPSVEGHFPGGPAGRVLAQYGKQVA